MGRNSDYTGQTVLTDRNTEIDAARCVTVISGLVNLLLSINNLKLSPKTVFAKWNNKRLGSNNNKHKTTLPIDDMVAGNYVELTKSVPNDRDTTSNTS